VIGLTVRFAFKPLVEAIAVVRGGRAREAELALLEKRVELLERELEHVRRGLGAGAVGSTVLELPERTRSSSLG
ncbi:MAG: hypothetical protein L0Y64_25925, partial [Myxococcaceae bacterium]|nr:hypothetical protein [Myxococcaceae bacterium]